MHEHDGYAPHSHEVRADHLGVEWDRPDDEVLIIRADTMQAVEAYAHACGISRDVAADRILRHGLIAVREVLKAKAR